MIILYKVLEAYKKNQSPRNLRALRGMLNRSHKFAGFTRTYAEVRKREHYVSPSLKRKQKSEAARKNKRKFY